jgi:hypothetical protein
MSRELVRHGFRLNCALVLPLCLALSACGDGGTYGVANIPPPPVTPTPTPASAVRLDVKITPLQFQGTQAGTYDLLGRLISTPSGGTSFSRVLAAGEASMTIAKQSDILNFDLNGPGIFPPGGIGFASPERSWSATNDPENPQIFEDDQHGSLHQYLGQRITAYRIHPDGTEERFEWSDFMRGTSTSAATGATPASILTYNIGNAYVAMGEWSSSVVQPGVQPAVELLFVNGDRTPPSGIPASGRATYDAHTLSLLSPYYDSAFPGIPFTLTADFDLRTIATRIDQDYQYYPDQMGFGEAAIRGAAILGIHVGGSAPFSHDGSFDIPLSGTVNYSATNVPVTPPSESVTGTMNGAFFGPNAEEVGGAFSLDRAGETPIQDAFVGKQH